MDNNLKQHLPWIVPFIFSAIFGAFQVWGLLDRVAALETNERVYDTEHRISRVEEFCCSEIKSDQPFKPTCDIK